MMRMDLNDLAYFAEVVGHGGFAAAGRALREPKSKLSRRIAALDPASGAVVDGFNPGADKSVQDLAPREEPKGKLANRPIPVEDDLPSIVRAMGGELLVLRVDLDDVAEPVRLVGIVRAGGVPARVDRAPVPGVLRAEPVAHLSRIGPGGVEVLVPAGEPTREGSCWCA